MRQKIVEKVNETYNGRVSKIDVKKVSVVDGEMATKIDFESIANKKEANKTHGEDALKKSIQRPKIF